MRRSIAAFLIAVMTMSSTTPASHAQSTSMTAGGLTTLATADPGPNLVQNPGFETFGPADWTTASGWTQDQLTKHSGTFSYRRDTGAPTSTQNLQLKAG